MQLIKHQDKSYDVIHPIDKLTEADNPNLILHLRNNFLMAPSSLPYNLTTDKREQLFGRGHTWPFIDETLKVLFPNQINGFFVEAGALNGEFLSNTLRLEQELNWTGLLVEPEHHNFEELVQKRRKAWISQACLSNTKYPKNVTVVSLNSSEPVVFLHPLNARGSSFQLGYSGSDIPESVYVKRKFSINFCFPLYSFLLALNVTVVDFLSLDIQGPEIDVFNTIPFDKIYIRSMVIENLQNGNFVDEKFVNNIEEKGFKFIRVHGESVDYFFVNKDDEVLVEKSNKFIIEETKYNELGKIVSFGNLSYLPENASENQ